LSGKLRRHSSVFSSRLKANANCSKANCSRHARQRQRRNGRQWRNGVLLERQVLLLMQRNRTADLLLVNNTNLQTISHHFPVIVDYWSNFRFWQSGTSL